MTDSDYWLIMDEIVRLWDAQPGTPEYERLGKLIEAADVYENERWPMGRRADT